MRTAKELLEFLQKSPTPYHAVRNMIDELRENGFNELREEDAWKLQPGGHHFVSRGGSALIAFRLPAAKGSEGPFRMVGTHTDSPCLKVKPNPEMEQTPYFQLGVEIYGGVLLAPWFDRDLSIAGRVTFQNQAGELGSELLDFGRPVAVIPNLAIHLNRDANDSRSINRQIEMPPLLCRLDGGADRKNFRKILQEEMKNQGQADVDRVLSYDLCFYDTQAPARVGLKQEFIASARLDNLLSCYVGLQALIESSDATDAGEVGALLVCNDHEEVGSASAVGAQGPFLKAVLERVAGSVEGYHRLVARSMLISADNAHGLHPNYPDKHDSRHAPILNQGPVIKINANQRYATTAESAAIFERLCQREEVPFQKFVARSDMGCGSTIGPITAAALGVTTLDIGIPTFAMHSIRELAGSEDADYLIRVLRRFMSEKSLT